MGKSLPWIRKSIRVQGIFYSAKLYYKHKDLYNEHVRIKYTMLLYRQ